MQELKSHKLFLLLLLLLTAAVYGQTVAHDFLSNWDDNFYVTHNDVIKGVTLKNLKSSFSTIFGGNYAPVHIISYMLDHALWGMNPSGFHLTNLILHAGNGFLIYLLVVRICGSTVWAFFTAAIFLLHPVQVESVAWISQRKNLLSMFFSLLTLLSYLSFRRGPSGQALPPYLLAIAFCCLALLSKSVAVILPVVLLLVDLCCESPPRKTGIWIDKLPFIAVSAAVAVVTIVLQSPEMGGGRTGFYGNSAISTFFTMQTVLMRYIGMLLWPQHLNTVYLPDFKQVIDSKVVFSMLCIVALAFIGYILFRRSRIIFFGYAIFFIGLLPVSQIVPLVTLMNDRYLYFPMLGVAWVAGGLSSRMVDTSALWRRRIAVGTCVVVLFLMSYTSYKRALVWGNSIILWTDSVSKLPHSWEVRSALADAQVNAGLTDEALRTYGVLFTLQRDSVDADLERKALNNAAVLYMNIGRNDIAFPLLKELVTRFPDYPIGFINMGNNRRAAKNLPEAEQAYRRALALQPDNVQVLTLLGNVSLEAGKLDSARDFYSKTLARGGSSAELYFGLACLEAKDHQAAKALDHLKEALRLGYADYSAVAGNPALEPVRRLAQYREMMRTVIPKMKLGGGRD